MSWFPNKAHFPGVERKAQQQKAQASASACCRSVVWLAGHLLQPSAASPPGHGPVQYPACGAGMARLAPECGAGMAQHRHTQRGELAWVVQHWALWYRHTGWHIPAHGMARYSTRQHSTGTLGGTVPAHGWPSLQQSSTQGCAAHSASPSLAQGHPCPQQGCPALAEAWPSSPQYQQLSTHTVHKDYITSSLTAQRGNKHCYEHPLLLSHHVHLPLHPHCNPMDPSPFPIHTPMLSLPPAVIPVTCPCCSPTEAAPPSLPLHTHTPAQFASLPACEGWTPQPTTGGRWHVPHPLPSAAKAAHRHLPWNPRLTDLKCISHNFSHLECDLDLEEKPMLTSNHWMLKQSPYSLHHHLLL